MQKVCIGIPTLCLRPIVNSMEYTYDSVELDKILLLIDDHTSDPLPSVTQDPDSGLASTTGYHN